MSHAEKVTPPAASRARCRRIALVPDPADRTLSHYRIVRALGAGGMGEVFVAHDTKLGRDVALKILPASMAADPDRRERFAREARAIAALNHPNIVTVHSVEEAPAPDPGQPGVTFLTMELIEGRTLADLLPAKGLPLDQLLKLAIPLADAVGAAHAKGITHRDLKPANVMVTSDGRVKVLDFGLAKLRDEAPRAEGSVTTLEPQPLTGEGRIVGTVTYMSPEQAEGKTVDHRSDIFSLGVMLYEMATGERPFKGDSNVSTLSSILRDTPRAVTDLNPGLPRDLAKLIRRALTKDPEHRFQSAKDLRNELEELKQDLDSGELSAVAVPSPAGRGRPRVVWMWAGVGAVLVTCAWLAITYLSPGESAPPPVQATFTHVTSAAGIETSPGLSPDGKWLVYASAGDIFLQSVGGQVPINLTKDEPAADYQPAFSPDGERIAFGSARGGGGVFVMSKTGESVRRLTTSGFNPAWTPDGRFVVYGSATTMDPDDRTIISEGWKVDVESGQSTRISAGDFVQPAVSPNGQRIAFWALPVTAEAPLTFSGNDRDLWTMRLDGSDRVRVTDDAATDWSPVWSEDGRYLYFASDRGGSMNLWRVAIDEVSGRVSGSFQAITTPSTWLGFISRSSDGRRLAYAAYDFAQNLSRVPLDPVPGKVTGSAEAVTSGTMVWARPDAAPDGATVAFTSSRRQEDLFVARKDGSGSWKLAQVTNDVARDRSPRWSPDGTQIAFYSNRSGRFSLWTVNVDGSGLRERVSMPMTLLYPLWSPPDGSRMMATQIASRRNYIFTLGETVVSQPTETLPPFPEADAAFTAMSWSPDGRKVAGYASRNTTVWVYSLDSKTYTRIVPGALPVWLADSRRLIYTAGSRLHMVDTVTKESREILALPGESLSYPAIGRDDRWLYYTHATTGADIWLMTIK
jgi:eukaryotic-like serine/threonine-protein kinase